MDGVSFVLGGAQTVLHDLLRTVASPIHLIGRTRFRNRRQQKLIITLPVINDILSPWFTYPNHEQNKFEIKNKFLGVGFINSTSLPPVSRRP